MNDTVSGPLAHLAAAQASALEIPGMRRNQNRRPIASVGIVGAGTMGTGIAMNFLAAGIPCTLVEASQEALARGIDAIARLYSASVDKGRLSAAEKERRMSLLHGVLEYQAIAACDLVIEAVYENLNLKKTVLQRLGAVLRPGAIIATNTSTLDVNALADATGRPADVLGMHFFSPANVMKLLEIVRGARTSADVLATIVDLAPRIGKIPVVSGVCYGFIGNRMAEVYMREMEFLLLEAASPADIDGAVEALGMAMGPCRMLDLAGIDVGAKTVIEWKKAGGAPKDPTYRVVVNRLFDLGMYGQKTGAGYYEYSGRTPLPSAATAAVVAGLAANHGIDRGRTIAADEIVERLLFPMINEGCRILEEGIAYRPGDIDVVWVFGYGFPSNLGGPMHWAENEGLSKVLVRLRHYSDVRGNEFGYWTPARLLVDAVASGRSLSQQLSSSGAR